jgi:hypothetical protein
MIVVPMGLLWLPSAFTQPPHYHSFVLHELYKER